MRTTVVSTTKLRNYQRFIFIMDAIIFIGLASFLMYSYLVDGTWNVLLLPATIYLQFHLYFPMFLKLKDVSYDESSVYYNKKDEIEDELRKRINRYKRALPENYLPGLPSYRI